MERDGKLCQGVLPRGIINNLHPETALHSLQSGSTTIICFAYSFPSPSGPVPQRWGPFFQPVLSFRPWFACGMSPWPADHSLPGALESGRCGFGSSLTFTCGFTTLGRLLSFFKLHLLFLFHPHLSCAVQLDGHCPMGLLTCEPMKIKLRIQFPSGTSVFPGFGSKERAVQKRVLPAPGSLWRALVCEGKHCHPWSLM